MVRDCRHRDVAALPTRAWNDSGHLGLTALPAAAYRPQMRTRPRRGPRSFKTLWLAPA